MPRILLAACLAVATGCALFGHGREERAARIEPLLAAAGFQAVPAPSAEHRRRLESLPPLRLTYSTRGGQPHYWYADPYRCQCLYTGGETQYARYEQLLAERDVAEEARAATMFEEDAASIDREMDYWLPAGAAMWPAGSSPPVVAPEMVEP